jgi:predicted DsbA family dithiol-disulfide isomerase
VHHEGAAVSLTIDVISDVVCPWCYIGKRRLEAALALAPETPPPAVNWRPFQLNPDLPPAGVPRAEYVARKFGARGGAIYERVAAVGREVGIPFAFDRIIRQPNTLAAHSLIDLARGRGIQGAVVEAFFRAYFIEGADLTARTTLISIATSAGLDQAEVEKRLDDRAAGERVGADDAHVRAIGIDGVPYFIFNGRLAVSGAQASEVLLDAMRQATTVESTA